MKYNLWMVLALFAVALVLIILTQFLLKRLQVEVPAQYKSMGEPDLFQKNDILGAYKFWQWIYLAPSLSDLSNFSKAIVWTLRVYAPVYSLFVLAGMIASLFIH